MSESRDRRAMAAVVAAYDSAYRLHPENRKNEPASIKELRATLAQPDPAVALAEALRYALPYIKACVPNPRNGVNADCSPDVNVVDRAIAALRLWEESCR